MKSKDNDGCGIYIGAAPFDIGQNENYNHKKCGWYFYCYSSTLYSGPPHNCKNKEYGPRKEKGKYVHTGDSVGVVMDTTKGELSFVLNCVKFGVAYEGIPLDKPLVPCVLLWEKEDSVELDTSEVKENVNGFIYFPSDIIIKSATWDTVTLSWDIVEGASFYQIEVDGSKFCDASTTNAFTKRGLLADTEHSFRVRTVCGNEVSEWSNAVEGRTQKESFETSRWKECPVGVDEERGYSINLMNPKLVLKNEKCNQDCCSFCFSTVIGNMPLPLNKVTSWSIKILKSCDSDGHGIYIGTAPSGINQNEDNNYKKCGWYLDCYDSTLVSGPPHNYEDKEHGPRKGKRWRVCPHRRQCGSCDGHNEG